MADTTATIAANASAYKDSIESQFRAQDAALNQQQIGVEQAKAQSIAQAAGQVGSAVSGLASGLDKGSSSADTDIADTNAKIAEFDKKFSPTLQAPTLGQIKA